MLLPYASDRPPRNPPLAVVLMVLINFAVFGVFALAMLRGGPGALAWYVRLSLVPGALTPYAPLTYAFLHAGVLHMSVNMLFLWVFGGSVEDAVGWKRFMLLYLTAAAFTGLAQAGMAWAIPGADRMTPIVGASGAVAAVVGVFAVRFYRSRIRFIGLPWRVPAVVLVALVLLGEMGAVAWRLVAREPGDAPLTAHWAHIAGFLLGLVWGQATRMVKAGRHEYLAADARMEMEQGSPLAAARRWETVLVAQPGNLEAEAELGRAWAMVGDREPALEHYRRAIAGLLRQGDRREAGARLREMAGFYPDAVLDAPQQFAAASALEEVEDFPAAVAAFEALARAHPDAREAEMALLRVGTLRLRRLDAPREAAGTLQAFLDRYPESAWRAYAEELLRTAKNEAGDETTKSTENTPEAETE